MTNQFQREFQSSGLILRRCTLDAVGLAYWESPTHIKCISENYKTIQTMVSLRPTGLPGFRHASLPRYKYRNIMRRSLTVCSLFSVQAQEFSSQNHTGQGIDGIPEVISRLRSSTDQGATYSGDLLATMEILRNTTEMYKGTSLRMSNADKEVRLTHTCVYISIHLDPSLQPDIS